MLFCRMLLETHNPYKPAVIDWPKLGQAERDRLAIQPDLFDQRVSFKPHCSFGLQRRRRMVTPIRMASSTSPPMERR